jgi:hypothetical protein
LFWVTTAGTCFFTIAAEINDSKPFCGSMKIRGALDLTCDVGEEMTWPVWPKTLFPVHPNARRAAIEGILFKMVPPVDTRLIDADSG